ncbi:MAG: helix-turn-helix transcriptional regulator [Pseudolabrys sp.]|nr:helix-turn-helix transcriptional regulator [Pseudolabrys sp.]
MSSPLHDASYRAFVDHLTAVRGRAGVTQAELARRLAKPQSYISKIERYERRIDPAEFRAIAMSLGTEPADAFAAVIATLK